MKIGTKGKELTDEFNLRRSTTDSQLEKTTQFVFDGRIGR